MTLLMKLWSWQDPSRKGNRMNTLENFHIQVHKFAIWLTVYHYV
jgi:hypothetical protein